MTELIQRTKPKLSKAHDGLIFCLNQAIFHVMCNQEWIRLPHMQETIQTVFQQQYGKLIRINIFLL